MKKDILLSQMKAKLTSELYDIAIKLAHIKFDKENIRSKFYQSVIDGNIDLNKEWEAFSTLYRKYEKAMMDKLKRGDLTGVDVNNALVIQIMNKIK